MSDTTQEVMIRAIRDAKASGAGTSLTNVPSQEPIGYPQNPDIVPPSFDKDVFQAPEDPPRSSSLFVTDVQWDTASGALLIIFSDGTSKPIPFAKCP
ncbi:MAG: hypothetical protein WCK57_00685 [Verrucomicrobiae bacterium]